MANETAVFRATPPTENRLDMNISSRLKFAEKVVVFFVGSGAWCPILVQAGFEGAFQGASGFGLGGEKNLTRVRCRVEDHRRRETPTLRPTAMSRD